MFSVIQIKRFESTCMSVRLLLSKIVRIVKEYDFTLIEVGKCLGKEGVFNTNPAGDLVQV